MRNKEYGRSMLEMIVVIVLMLILALGSLYTWQIAQEKSSVKTLAQKIVALKVERRLNIGTPTNQQGENAQTYPGPLGTELKVVNGLGEQNKDHFWITVSKVNSSLCGALVKSDLIQSDKIDDNCDGIDPDATFYFPKYSDVSVDGSPDRDRQPSECAEGYWGTNCNKSCPTGACVHACGIDGLSCAAGCYRDGDDCKACTGDRRYSGIGQSSCSTCPAGQTANSDHTGCEICTEGEKCGCVGELSSDGLGGCTCPEGKYLGGINCKTCPANATCTGTGFTCKTGYYKVGDSCVSCPENATCGGNSFSCKTGYYKVGDSCVSCPANSTCGGNSFTCKTGYYKVGGSCVSCPENATCSGNSFTCKTGYYKVDNVCISCPVHATCNGNTFTCNAGYYKHGNQCDACDGERQYSHAGALVCSTCTLGTKPNASHSDCIACVSDGTESCGCPAGKKPAQSGSGCSNCSRTENCGCGDVNANGNGGCQCPAHSSTTVREGQQIGTTSCYCNEGYLVNGEGCSCNTTSCGNGKYCDTNGVCQGCEVKYAAQKLCRGTALNYENGCPQTIIENCGTSTPVCNNSNTCEACPTQITQQIIVNNSGDCKNKCSNVIETLNDDNTYTCTYCTSTAICDSQCCTGEKVCDINTESPTYHTCICPPAKPYWDEENQVCAATPNCMAAMLNAGFENSQFSVSGNTVTWNPNKRTYRDSLKMKPSKDLDLLGCDLVINGTLENSYSMTVNNLTTNLLGSSSSSSVIFTNDGTLNVKGNLRLSSESNHSGLDNNGSMTIDGNVDTTNAYFGTYSGGNTYVKGNINVTGTLQYAMGVLVDYGTLTVDGYVKSKTDDFPFRNKGTTVIHGYLRTESTSVSASGTSEDGLSMCGGSLTVDGDITAIASQSDAIANSSAGNFSGIQMGCSSGSNAGIIKSLHGDIVGQGHSGILFFQSGIISAPNGSVEGYGKKSHGIEGPGSGGTAFIEAKGSVVGENTADNGAEFGIAAWHLSIKAGGGITASGSSGMTVQDATVISCDNVSASGSGSAAIGMTFASGADVQVKGQISGSVSNRGDSYGQYLRIRLGSGVNIENIHARSFSPNSYSYADGCSASNGYCTAYYPPNSSYTPEWCNNMTFTP